MGTVAAAVPAGVVGLGPVVGGIEIGGITATTGVEETDGRNLATTAVTAVAIGRTAVAAAVAVRSDTGVIATGTGTGIVIHHGSPETIRHESPETILALVLGRGIVVRLPRLLRLVPKLF